MADQAGVVSPSAKGKQSVGPDSSATKPKRQKRVYDHEMSASERFALQACIKAKNALAAIAVHIQEGKGCKPEIVKSALAIQSAAADVLFAE